MATLRQLIAARVEGLTNQITQIKENSTAAIAPLQSKIQAEEQKLVYFALFLDQDLPVVRARLNTLIDGYL